MNVLNSSQLNKHDFKRFKNFDTIKEDYQLESKDDYLTRSLCIFDNIENSCKKIGNVKQTLNLSSNLIGSHNDCSSSEKKILSFLDTNRMDEGVDEDDGDADDDAFFIERMQTICIRKSHDTKGVHLRSSNNNRRKSMVQFNRPDTRERDTVGEMNSWNYDELNDLRLKFMSLLSKNESTSLSPTTTSGVSSSSSMIRSECSSDDYETKRLSLDQASIIHDSIVKVNKQQNQLTHEDCVKIESFYSSFGTQLHVSNSFANLYTLTQITSTIDEATNQFDINKLLDSIMLNDFDTIEKSYSYKLHQHSGIPLWLFNTGMNPRRPYRQIKFTLAEYNTGFILWQDRIDTRSELKVYIKKSNTNDYFTIDNLIDYQHQKLDFFDRTFLISFKASDRKTIVFVKFNVKQELFNFFDYFIRIHYKMNDELRQRTKSLPVQMNVNDASTYHRNATIMRHNVYLVKYRRISKNDISKPFDCKHFINVKLSDKNLYYTLSKLIK